MSLATLCEAVKDRIVSALVLTNDGSLECDVTFDGEPNPMAGEQFIAVHPALWQGISTNLDHFAEKFGVAVTVSRKLNQTPKDKWGPEIWKKADTGLDAIARKIVVAVHGNYANVFAGWDTELDAQLGDAEHGLAVALWFLNADMPQLRSADWFSADHQGVVGVSQTLRFGNAERIQNITGPPN